jgi:hypothetical protein
MHNLERNVYRIRCLTRMNRPYLNTYRPFEHIFDWIKPSQSSLLRALVLESGVFPFMDFGNQGHLFNSKNEAELAAKRLVREASALRSWSMNPSIDLSFLKSQLESGDFEISDSAEKILLTEYVIDDLLVPSSEVMLSALSEVSENKKCWYVCVHYSERGYLYFKSGISDLPEDGQWLKEEKRYQSWCTKTESDAIDMAKRITRSKNMTIYAFPRYLDIPLDR